uniref:hypothetical protein n=2 Tax=Roseivirga sp. TaxID=1964215 RepID=UPI0040489496
MKFRLPIHPVISLVVFGCTSTPEPKLPEMLPEINATITGKEWKPKFAGIVFSEEEFRSGMTIIILDNVHSNATGKNRSLSITINSVSKYFSPIRPLNLFNTSDDFSVFSRFSEIPESNTKPIRGVDRQTEYNQQVGLEITEVRKVQNTYFLDGKFKSQPCNFGPEAVPSCLNIEGTFKDVVVLEHASQIRLYFQNFSF